MAESTVSTKVKIDINPEGITFLIEGLDHDLATLIEAAGTFNVKPTVYHTYDTSDVIMQSQKVLSFVSLPPQVTTWIPVVSLGAPSILVFNDDPVWQDSICGISVDGVKIPDFSSMISNGQIIIPDTYFPQEATYRISIMAHGYRTVSVQQEVTA
jgi:hypothetical protein